VKTIFCFWSGLSESWQIAILFSLIIPALGAFITIFWWLLKPNREFFKILDEFQEKLPPHHKRAKEDKKKFEVFTFIDTTKMETHLTTQDLDLFLRKLETFKYERILFRRKAIKAFSSNLQRIIRTSGWEKFGLALVQNLLEDEPYLKSKPYLFGYQIGKFLGF
jgi:hypothetical protein